MELDRFDINVKQSKSTNELCETKFLVLGN